MAGLPAKAATNAVLKPDKAALEQFHMDQMQRINEVRSTAYRLTRRKATVMTIFVAAIPVGIYFYTNSVLRRQSDYVKNFSDPQ